MPTYWPRPTGRQDQDDANDQIFRRLASLDAAIQSLDQQLSSLRQQSAPEAIRQVITRTQLILREQIPNLDKAPTGSEAGALIYVGSNLHYAANAPGTSGQAAISGGAGTPTWQSTEGSLAILTRNSTEDGGTVVTLTGSGGFTQPRFFPSGTASGPGVQIGTTNSGWFYDSGSIALALAGSERARFSTAGALQLQGSAPVLTMLRTSGLSITDATNATPIVVTSTSHGLSNGDHVYITGVEGNEAANGFWEIANVTANTFELVGSAGSGAYTTGGTAGQGAWMYVGSDSTLRLGRVSGPFDILTLDLQSGQALFAGQVRSPAGSASAPGVAVGADNTGWLLDSGHVDLSLAGTVAAAFLAAGQLQLTGSSPSVDLFDNSGETGRLHADGSDFTLESVSSGDIITMGLTTLNVQIHNDLEIDGDLNHDGSGIGLFGTAPASKATVTGSRAGNAALASLLTALAGYGLITDSSTA